MQVPKNNSPFGEQQFISPNPMRGILGGGGYKAIDPKPQSLNPNPKPRGPVIKREGSLRASGVEANKPLQQFVICGFSQKLWAPFWEPA